MLPLVDRLEGRIVRTDFTLTSPTLPGRLPEGVTPVGGAVLDLVGLNGRRVVSQVPASRLFQGLFNNGAPAEFRGNPGTIGVQSGFTPELLDALGGGLAELAVRLTVHDGDTGPGDFDRDENLLLLNGVEIGDFSTVVTQETDDSGEVALSFNPQGGFRNNIVDTGFFHATDANVLAAIFATIRETGAVRFQLLDVDPYDNTFDFTRGVSGGLIDTGQPPTPANLPPTITAFTVEEPVFVGADARVRVEANDPDGPDELLTYAFDVVGDGLPEFVTSSPVFEFPVAAPGPLIVIVRVMDPQGGATSDLLRFHVVNAPPTIDPPPTQHADEGTPTPFDLGTLIDAGPASGWTISVDWGDGSPVEVFTVTTIGPLGSREHVYRQDGVYTVLVTADDGTDTGSASFEIAVRNVDPTLDPPANQEADEGTAARFDLGTLADPGAEAGWTITVSWGDGSPVEVFTVTTTGPLGSREHVYRQDGRYVVVVSAGDGPGFGSAAFVVDVRNVPPTLTAPSEQEADEGTAARFALGTLADPGAEVGWTITVDWGDGSPVESFNVTETGDLGTLEHVYNQDGVWAVAVRAADDDAESVVTYTVRVRNLPPSIDAIRLPGIVLRGDRALLGLDVSDPGVLDALSLTVDWGDGTTAAESLAPGSTSARLAQVYARPPGVYLVTITLEDDAGASVRETVSIAVRGPAPVVDPPLALFPTGPGQPPAAEQPGAASEPPSGTPTTGAVPPNQALPVAGVMLTLAPSPGAEGAEDGPQEDDPGPRQDDSGSDAGSGGVVAVLEPEGDSAVAAVAPPAVEAPAAAPGGESGAAEAAVAGTAAPPGPDSEPEPRRGGATMTVIMILAVLRQRQPRFRMRRMAHARRAGR